LRFIPSHVLKEALVYWRWNWWIPRKLGTRKWFSMEPKQ
jgi:hypothetical protein